MQIYPLDYKQKRHDTTQPSPWLKLQTCIDMRIVDLRVSQIIGYVLNLLYPRRMSFNLINFHFKLSLTLYFIFITLSTPITSIKMCICNTTWHNITIQIYLPNYKRKEHNTPCDSSYELELICEMIWHAYSLITYTQRDLLYSSSLGTVLDLPFLFSSIIFAYFIHSP